MKGKRSVCPRFSSGAPIPNQNDYATMQTDGNFVIYNPQGTPLWATGTAGSGGSSIEVQDDGNFVLYIEKWQAGTYATPSPGPFPVQTCSIGTALNTSQTIQSNQCIVSPHGQYMLYMAPNGNFYIYDIAHNVATWSANTYNHPGAYAVMQGDGNFCVYAADGTFLWMSGTNGTLAERLEMEDDGRIIIFRSAWSSGTSQGWSTTSRAHPACDVGYGTGLTGTLGSGQCFVSPNGRYEVLMQTDGDLGLYDLSTTPTTLVWDTKTTLSPVDPSVALRTLYFYDPLGNLTCVEQHGGVSGTGCSAAPSSDATSPWRVRRFTYDSLGRLLSASNPESNTAYDASGNPFRVPTTYSYDADGNLLQKTSPAPNQTGTATQTISYCYDALHRVTGKAYSAQSCPMTSPVVTYTYDSGPNAKGHLTGVTDQAGSASYGYDVLGRLSSETRIIAGITKSISYDYNLDGSLKTLHYPSGAAITYAPDSAGRILSALDSANNINYVTSATYQADGQMTGFVSGNGGAFSGIASAFSYNKRLQPINMSANAPGQTVFSIGYDFHVGNGTSGADNGNVWNIYNFRDRTRDQSFNYDALNRLTSAQNAGTNCAVSTLNGKTEYWGNSYGYDAWGNLTGKTITKCGAELLNAPALVNNQLSGYGYDAAGNMTSDPTDNVTASYDAENRIASASTASGTFTYSYDADGNRVEKSGGGSGTLYWYMTPGIAAESDLAGNLKSEYVFFNGERVARKDFDPSTHAPAGVFYYFSDHLKTASVITDSAGNAKAESDYYPWGGELQFVANDSNHYKFTGKERDTESGLDYFGARYYSNGLGRWVSADWSATPIPVPYADFGDPQSLNLYTYVRNVPTSKVDADGHESPIVNDPAAIEALGDKFSKLLQGALKALQHPAVQAILSVATFGAGGAEDGVADGIGEGTAAHAAEDGTASAAKGSTEGAASQGTKAGTEEGTSSSSQESGLGRSSSTKQSGAQGQKTETTVKDPAGSTTYKTEPGKTGGQATYIVRKDSNGKTVYVKQEARTNTRDFRKAPDHVHYYKPKNKQVR